MFKIKRSELLVLLLAIVAISSSRSHSDAAAPLLNPFKTNAELQNYAVQAEQAALSDFPGHVVIPQLEERAREDIYQYMRLQIKDRIELWQVMLLDYARLRLLRNEIYARHGMRFQSQDLDEHFRSFSWYKPVEVFKESFLSDVDRANIALLQRVEFLNYRINERAGKLLKFDIQEGERTATKRVDEVNGYITVTSDGCCGSTWGDSTVHRSIEKIPFGDSMVIRKARETTFHASFGYDGGEGSIKYVVPEGGNNLVALIVGDIDKRGRAASNNLKNRVVVLDAQGEPLIDIKGHFPLPQGGEDVGQIALLEPNILYITGHTFSSGQKVLFYLKRKIAFRPFSGRRYQWLPITLEGTAAKTECLQGQSLARTPILNPVVLWDKPVPGRVIATVSTPVSIVVVTAKNDNSYQMFAADKLTGKQLWEQTISTGMIERHAYRDGNLYVIAGDRLTKFDLSNGKSGWNISVNYPSGYGWSPPVLLPGKENLLVGFGPVLDVYSIVDGAFKKRIDQTIDTSKENGIFQSKFHRYWLAGRDSIISYIVASEDRDHVPTGTMLYIVSYNERGSVSWRFAIPFEFETSGSLDESIAVRNMDCELYIVDDEKVIKLDPGTGKVLFKGKWPLHDDEGDRRYQRGTLLWYLGDKISWDRSMLKDHLTMNADGKSLSEVSDPTCTSRVVDAVVYLEESYYPGSISAVPKCSNGKNDGGYNPIWTISPWRGKPQEYQPRIIHVDHNYILATTGLHYWAIGETALRDSIWRKNGGIYVNIEREKERMLQLDKVQKTKKNQDKGTVNKLKALFGM